MYIISLNSFSVSICFQGLNLFCVILQTVGHYLLRHEELLSIKELFVIFRSFESLRESNKYLCEGRRGDFWDWKRQTDVVRYECFVFHLTHGWGIQVISIFDFRCRDLERKCASVFLNLFKTCFKTFNFLTNDEGNINIKRSLCVGFELWQCLELKETVKKRLISKGRHSHFSKRRPFKCFCKKKKVELKSSYFRLMLQRILKIYYF